MRARVFCGIQLVAAIMSVSVSAQAPVRVGTVAGTVRAAQADAPLAYAVVAIPALAIERFTDARGRFTIGGIAAGRHEVLVRRIGFAPYRGQVVIAEGQTSTINLTLNALAMRLATQSVRAITRCEQPGPPDSVRNADVLALLSLVRENAERFRLLAADYPFTYRQVRAVGELRDGTPNVLRVDTLSQTSGTVGGYVAGHVVRETGAGDYAMALPGILDLADDAFANAHCFGYGGSVVRATPRGPETWLRLDVLAAEALYTPDVQGRFFLDSASSALRRMELELTRTDQLPARLQSVESLRITTDFAEIAPGLSVVDAVCAITRPRTRTQNRDVVPMELQQLLDYAFPTPPPDVAAARAYPAPGWKAGARTPRSAVWCAR